MKFPGTPTTYQTGVTYLSMTSMADVIDADVIDSTSELALTSRDMTLTPAAAAERACGVVYHKSSPLDATELAVNPHPMGERTEYRDERV